MFRGGNMMDLSGQGDGSGAGVVHQMSMQPPPMQASYPTPGAGNLLHDSKLRLLTTPPQGTAAGTNGTSSAMIASNNASLDEAKNNASNKSKKPVRYRECLKNHAASIGGHAIDGCGEFMPSGEEGSIESLKCAACDCHRNFHKREVEGEPLVCDICHMNRRERNRKAAAIAAGVLTSPNTQSTTPGTGGTTPMPLATTPSTGRSLLALGGRNLEDHNMGGDSPMNLMSPLSMKKRFRTKFSMDQKERMFMFAEKLGWRIQKHDEAAVQQFCADVGVKRHVLKVWMHNNKHTFGKRSSTTPTSGMPITSPSAHPDMDSPPRHHITPPQQQQQ